MLDLWLLPVSILGVLYLYRADFQQYSVFTIGVFKRLYRYKATDQTTECSEDGCDSGVKEGEIRKATKEIVLFGCPLFRHNTVVNHYCPEHTSFEYRQGEFELTRTERLTETVVTAAVGFAEFKTKVPEQNESPFDDTLTATSSALNLTAVFMLILFMAPFVMVAKRTMGEM